MSTPASPASARRFVCRIDTCRHVHVSWAARCSKCLSYGLDPTTVELVKSGPAVSSDSKRPAALEAPAEAPPRPYLSIAPAPSPEPEFATVAEELASVVFPSAEAPVPISEIAEATFVRDSTGLAPLDYVLGGGLVVGSVVLLASPPGIGKSSLTLQMLAGLKHRCLYVTGEETREQLAATGRRVGAVSDQLYVVNEHYLDKIFAYAKPLRVQTIAIDSIQKMVCETASGRAGSPGQLKECTARLVDYAKKNDTALWLIGHVTSDGDIAGPRTVEHDVDVVLELEQGQRLEGRERLLKCPGKNRFGPTNVVGCFELTSEGFVPIDPDGWDEEKL